LEIKMAEKLKPGEIINHYEIVRVLGQSDIATVYLAKDDVQHRKWVIKEMADPVQGAGALNRFKENFLETCRQLSNLRHRGLVQIIDFFVLDDSKFYIVREFMEGRSLQEFVENSPDLLSGSHVRTWSQQIMEVVEYLHSQTPPVFMGVIVPRNLIISPMGKIRIMDLGLARFFPRDKQRETLLKISPGYTAPEILNEGAYPDARSDIFTLGATLHFFFTRLDPNKNPFGFKDISGIRNDISGKTSDAVARAISKSPRDRFESIADFKNAILGQSFKSEQTKIGCNVREIVIEDARQGELIPGSISLKNVGKGEMEGVIYASYSWLKVNPDRFKSNDAVIRYWVDTDYMEAESVQENLLTVKTDDEKLEIPVKVSLAPAFPRSVKAPQASLFMLLIPILLLLLLMALRSQQIDRAWNILLDRNGIVDKGITYVLETKDFLIKKTSFEPSFSLAGRFFALVMIAVPLAIPLVTGKFRHLLRAEVQKATFLPALISMVMPSLFLLMTAFQAGPSPLRILENSALKYLDLSGYLWFFVPVNVLAAVIFLAPRDDQNRNFIDNNSFLKMLSFALVIIYFVVFIILKVLA
jgi:serine/threonine protein kinase